jgi:glycolate oxidase iron-sulfur subunit
MTATTPGERHEPAGDGRRPVASLLDDCVHCGFCLAACPTYSLWGQEMDSPRGRIDLMRQADADGALNPSAVEHFDKCLGCMACVPACPSGVKYDLLIDAARNRVEEQHRRPLRERLPRALIFALFPYPRRLRLLTAPLWLYQRVGLDRLLRRSPLYRWLPATLRAMESIAPPVRRARLLPEHTAAVGVKRARVGLLTGCVQSVFFPGVNAATLRVLAAEGCEVVVPKRQGCCGALSAHNGRRAEAARFARALIDTMAEADVDTVIVNSAGCGSTMKDYAELLAGDPAYAAKARDFAARTKDIAEFLDELGAAAPRHPLPVTIAYHDACHLSNAQGIRSAPRRLLAAIPGLSIKEIPDGHMCCGSAGIYNLLQPDAAAQLGDRKAANVASTHAQILVTANPGCTMQISAALGRKGHNMRAAHTVQILDLSLRAASPDLVASPSAAPPDDQPR